MPQSDPTRLISCQARKIAAASSVALLLLTLCQVSSAAAVFDPNAQPSGWSMRPALTSNTLKSGTEIVYRPEYKAGLWTGTVRANYIDADGVVQEGSPWASADTATLLAAANWDTDRRIVTRTSGGTSVPFRWDSLDAGQKTALGGATSGPNLLNFVRGDRSNEAPSGTKLRTRSSVQGDIQHSSLVYWKHLSGPKRLYVGGNGGMVHAFDATTGSEVFAYVPSMLLSRLPALAASPYVHNLYVDGGLAMADVAISGSQRTLLAGALGGGGRGLFMLDVTSPTPASEAAAAGNIKWEITSSTTGFANLGYSYAAPRLTRMNNGVAAVVVGNGYMNTGTGRATLLVINADTGALVREIDTGSGSTGSPNGLSTATLVDTDADGKADYAYAGDIDGNLWRFDLRGSDSAAWSVSKLLTTSPQQAITTAPAIANHPNGGRMVLIGTGRVLTPADESDTAVGYVYGLWDGAPAANTTWLDQALSETTSGAQRLRRLTTNAPNWASGGHRGWRLPLTAGERVVGEGPFVIDDRFYFSTTNPTVPAAADGQASGANWLVEVNFLTGGSPTSAVFDINNDGRIDTSDNLGGTVVVGKFLGAGIASQPVLADLSAFSQSLFNLQSDIDYSPNPGTHADLGVSGGHFDIDFFYMSGSSYARIKHVHEYDDVFDVTGVNFLSPSESTLRLGSKLGNNVNFKVLAMNQYLNPASMLSLGGAGFVSVKDFAGMTTATSATTLLAGLSSYKLSNVGSLAWKVPLDAFKSKDWWGDGTAARSGLMPTVYSCVWAVNSNGSPASPSVNGQNGEWRNGALTVQLIKDSTPASALEMNYAAGGAKYGWRVKPSEFTNYVLAEYALYWHHPNGKCYGKPGWLRDPPQDFTSDATPATPAAGSSDPKDGVFGVTPAGETVVSSVTTVSGNTTTLVVTYSDGTTETTVTTINSNGTETRTTTDRNGVTNTSTRMSASSVGNAPQEILQGSRRINWRELVRQ